MLRTKDRKHRRFVLKTRLLRKLRWANATIEWAGRISLARLTALHLFLSMTVTRNSDSPIARMKFLVHWARKNSDSLFAPSQTSVLERWAWTLTRCWMISWTWGVARHRRTDLLRAIRLRSSGRFDRTALVSQQTQVWPQQWKEASAWHLMREGRASKCSSWNDTKNSTFYKMQTEFNHWNVHLFSYIITKS